MPSIDPPHCPGRGLFHFLVFCFLTVIPGTGLAAAPVLVAACGLYSDSALTKKEVLFSPYDTIYAVVSLPRLGPGTYTLTTDWYGPSGALEHQNSHEFIFEDTHNSSQFSSWMRLWHNGPVRRMMTGSDFKKKFYGRWTVSFLLNGRRIAKESFQVL